MAYIYRHITKDTNEVFYIGASSDRNYKRSKNKSNRSNEWKEIASKGYEVEIMFEHNDFDFIKQKEIEFISLYGRKDLNKGSLINFTDGGDGVLGRIMSDETKIKKTLSTKGVKRPQQNGENNPMYGKKHSEESVKKMSIAKKGKNTGEDNFWFGRKLYPETIEKMKANHARPNLGKTTPDDVRLKISIANKGKKKTQQQKENLSRAKVEYHKNNENKLSKLVLDTQMGIFYENVKYASIAIGYNRTTLTGMLNGSYKNKTNLIYA